MFIPVSQVTEWFYGSQHMGTVKIVKWLSDPFDQDLNSGLLYSAIAEDKMPCPVVKTWIKNNRGQWDAFILFFFFSSGLISATWKYINMLALHQFYIPDYCLEWKEHTSVGFRHLPPFFVLAGSNWLD